MKYQQKEKMMMTIGDNARNTYFWAIPVAHEDSPTFLDWNSKEYYKYIFISDLFSRFGSTACLDVVV